VLVSERANCKTSTVIRRPEEEGIMNFTDVIEILDKSVGGPDADVASHGPFWRGVSRDTFVEMKVGGRKLVILGDGANSNLVLSLKGQAPFGSDLDDPPAGAVTPQMPAYLDPISLDEISDIEQWINEGCPAD
jgi:hypothetical protein